MTVLSVMRNTKESLQGPLGKDLTKLSQHLPLFMTMQMPQITRPGWNISLLWVESHTTLLGPLGRQFILGSMIQHFTGTLEGTSCPTWNDVLFRNSDRPFHITSCPLHIAHITRGTGGSHFVSTHHNIG